MTSAFDAVARGLRLAHVGYLLACWGSAAAVGIPVVVGRSFSYSTEMWWVVMASFWASVLLVVAGVVIGVSGRVRCMKIPEEFPAARGRLLAAVILEGCGWASLLVGVGVLFAMEFRWLPDAPWVPAIGASFSGLLLLGGRVMFLRFARDLAGVLDDPTSVRLARLSLTLLLCNFATGLFGVGIMVGGSVLSLSQPTQPLAFVIWFGAGMSVLAGLFVYDRLLGGLARSVRAFADGHRDDEVERVMSRKDRDTEAEQVS